ncbi:MAG: N-acetylmuramoyl-L-alanine amidase [Cyanobacteria bacterium J06639_1]
MTDRATSKTVEVKRELEAVDIVVPSQKGGGRKAVVEAIANVQQARKLKTPNSQISHLTRPHSERRSPRSPARFGAWLLSLTLGVQGLSLGAGAIAIALMASAVDAPAAQAQARNRLRSHTFNSSLNHLVINTSGPVTPKMGVVDTPTRIVVDLPNTTWGRPEKMLRYTGSIKSVRISQFNPTTTRFVLDVADGVKVSPKDVVLDSSAPNAWVVKVNVDGKVASAPLEPLLPPRTSSSSSGSGIPPLPPQLRTQRSPVLPLPSRSAINPPTSTPPLGPPPTLNGRFSPPAPSAPPPVTFSGPKTRVYDIQDTAEGFFIPTSGRAQVSTRLVFDPHRVVVDVINGDLSGIRAPKQRGVNRLGVSSVRHGQWQRNIARIVLDVAPSSSDWQATYDAARGGIRLYPAGGAQSATLIPNVPSGQSSGPLANISSVQVQGNRLVLNADGFLFYTSGWDPKTGEYRLSVTPARLPQSLPNPGLSANSPVELIRFEQVNPRTVSVLVKPSQGFTIAEDSSNQGTRRIALDIRMMSALPGNNSRFTITRPPNTRVQPTTPTLRPPAPTTQRPTNGSGITVAIDPGHGGYDPGAIGVGGVQEKRVNMAVSNRVKAMLEARGYRVVMTRWDDREIDLQPRIDTAVRGRANIFVSIHSNALDRSDISGIETYYLRPDSARLAQVMHRNLVRGSGGAIDRRIRKARFYVVRHTPTSMPSVLLEMGYLTNPNEGRRLADPNYQERLAQGIVNGIDEYFGQR